MHQSRFQELPLLALVSLSLIIGSAPAIAGTVISSGSGNWNDGANWSPAVPTSGDDVAITTANLGGTEWRV